jgi:hypothetical protein
LLDTVKDALERGESRWGDSEYLNRIIFSEMVKDEVMDTTGYGIGTALHGDTSRVVEVNHDEQTVTSLKWYWNDEGGEWLSEGKWAFKELCLVGWGV